MLNKLPLLEDSVIRKQEGEISSLEMKIDPKKYVYLYDHKFGGDCFVPATAIIEIFSEAALWFANELKGIDGLQVTGVEKLFIERAIAINPEKTLTINISCNEIEINDAECATLAMEITSPRENKKGKIVGSRRNGYATVVLGKRKPSNTPLSIPEKEFNSYNFDQSVYYDYYYPSHGPLFQSLTGKFMISDDKEYIVGQYDCAEQESRFVKDKETKFVLSPLGYDSCLQYAVYLSRVKDLFGRLPIAADSIVVHREHPVNGICTVIVKCLHIDDDIMDCDFKTYNTENELILSAKKFRVKRAFFHKYGRSEFDEPLNKNKVESPFL